jgi:hypothetical protein
MLDRTQQNDPTQATYTALREAWDHFNERLFAGELPDCLVTRSWARACCSGLRQSSEH